MSKFFDQYNAILEKSLQKVRLRVDPNVKYAEDFAQYDGYVGYILAETDDSFDFFYENSTVTLPKNVVFTEGFWDATKKFGQGLASGTGNFVRGVAGQNTGSSVAGAAGSILRQVGSKVGQLYGLQPGASQPAAAPSQPGSQLKFGTEVDRSRSFAIKTADGFAVIEINGAKYGIVKGSIMDNNNRVLLNSFTFDHVINFHLTALNEQGGGFSNLPKYAGQGGPLPGNKIPTASAPTASAPAPTASSQTQSQVAPTLAGTTQTSPQSSVSASQFTPISEITVANLKAKNALMVPLKVAVQAYGNNVKDPSPKTHSAMFTVAPNGQEVLFNFLD